MREELAYEGIVSKEASTVEWVDYSQSGAYFITFCVKDRHVMLGQINVGRGILDAPLVESIEFLNNRNNEIAIDKYAIMPNHVHLIVIVKDLRNGALKDAAPY